MSDADPGVPEAVPATLRFVRDELGAEQVYRLWLFPPLKRGRREWGLVAVARWGDEQGRMRLYTALYVAERTGKGLTVEPELKEEGMASVDRLDRVMEGVARRAELDLGDPRKVEIEGDPDRLRSLLEELDAAVPEVGEF